MPLLTIGPVADRHDDSVTTRCAMPSPSTTSAGVTFAMPPKAAISRVCARSYSAPTSKNDSPAMSPWLNICTLAPMIPAVVPAPMPSIT